MNRDGIFFIFNKPLMLSKKHILLVFCILLAFIFHAQSGDSLAIKQEKRKTSRQEEISRLLQTEAQYPDSFFIKRWDFDLASAYYFANDTLNFIKTAGRFLTSDDSKDRWRTYNKTTLSKMLYRLAKAQHDTLKMIEYGEKRLFVYNRLKCSTGERGYRASLFDELIPLYTGINKPEKAESMAKAKLLFIKEDKLKMPSNLSN
jgi:hypothetical protein